TVLPQALLLMVLAGATLVVLWRRPGLGFLGAWFFVILAPSSSVLPLVSQTVAEHRMYLPLAALISLGAVAICRFAERTSLPVFGILIVALGFLTHERNRAYATEIAIWTDTVAKRPENPRAHDSPANALNQAGRVDEAVAQYREALRVNPRFAS